METQNQQQQGDEPQQLHDSHLSSSSVKISHLRLAKQDTAELLTGFKVGTIPPIGHAFPLRIFVDQSLSSPPRTQIQTQQQQQIPIRKILLSGGSGSLRHSLLMTCENLVSYGNERWGRGTQAQEQCYSLDLASASSIQPEAHQPRTPVNINHNYNDNQHNNQSKENEN
jgi:hypothetical protein